MTEQVHKLQSNGKPAGLTDKDEDWDTTTTTRPTGFPANSF